MLVNEGFADRTHKRRFESLTEEFRALYAARVRRDDAELPVAMLHEVLDKDWRCGERNCAAAEGILERCWIVNFESDNGVGPHRLKHACNITRRNRIIGFCPAIFPGVAQIGDNGGNAPRARVL